MERGDYSTEGEYSIELVKQVTTRACWTYTLMILMHVAVASEGIQFSLLAKNSEYICAMRLNAVIGRLVGQLRWAS